MLLEEVTTMDLLAEDSYLVTMEAIVRYAGASGDFTPLHYDRVALAATGHDDFFAMGMLVAGRLGGLVATTWGDEAVRAISVRFVQTSRVGSTVTTRVLATGQPGHVRLEAVADDGSVVATGTAEVTSG